MSEMIERVETTMRRPTNIRNMCVIAHVDHGKTTLTDSLVASGGFIRKEDAGTVTYTDTMKLEQDRGITIKSTGISLTFEVEEEILNSERVERNSNEFLINLIDSPGHVDFSSEVTAALRLTDGALVVIDCVEGVCVQTETVLRQAIQERIKPVLTINKIDRAFLELQYDSETMYTCFSRAIESTNVILSESQDEDILGDLSVSPDNGTVSFSSGYQGWAFSLNTFARIYSKKLGTNSTKLIKKLWGDNFFDKQTKKWSKSKISSDGRTLDRGFCLFVIEPIQKVFTTIMGSDPKVTEKEILEIKKLADQLNVKILDDEFSLIYKNRKDLLKIFMRKWLPASDCLSEMIITKLPSPLIAQKYRVENLYSGPLDDEIAESIRNCNPNGPLVMYIAKNVPNPDYSRFFSFGRIFSGTITGGQSIFILGPEYSFENDKKDKFKANVQTIRVMMGKKMESIGSVPCGNTAVLGGIDSWIIKTATIVDKTPSFPLVSMKYSVSPVMRQAIEPKKPSEISKLTDGLKKLSKSDPLISVSINKETGECIIAGAGELHLEVCLTMLREDFLKGVEIIVKDPIVEYRETIIGNSVSPYPGKPDCMTKSPNKHNRLYVKLEPLEDELIKSLDNGEINLQQDIKQRISKFKEVTNGNWESNEVKKIWSIAPVESLDNTGATNILIDSAKGVQYLNEIKDSFEAGFQWVCKEGPLANEPLRGIKIGITDVELHADSIHRGGAQIIPPSRKVILGSLLTAQPRLLEPVYLAEISCPPTKLSGIFNVLNKRRGTLLDNYPHPTMPQNNIIKAHLPVAESFGFTEDLRSETSGQAFPQCSFSHFDFVPGDPLEEGTKANQIVKEIRQRKSLPQNIPSPLEYLDKI